MIRLVCLTVVLVLLSPPSVLAEDSSSEPSSLFRESDSDAMFLPFGKKTWESPGGLQGPVGDFGADSWEFKAGKNRSNVERPDAFELQRIEEQSPQMRDAWEKWDHRISEELMRRFDSLRAKAFGASDKLEVEIEYIVNRDGSVCEVKLLQKSSNCLFDRMGVLILRSMNGNPALEFPSDSKLARVSKRIIFKLPLLLSGQK